MMFLQGLSGPTTQLLGLGEPVFGLTAQGTAYGADKDHSGKTDALFHNLQQTLNRFVTVAAFAPVAIDGKLGQDSLRAAQVVTKYLAQTFPTQPAATILPTMTPNIPTLARSSQLLFDTLRFYADQKALVAPPVPPRSPPTPSNQLPPAPGDMTFPVAPGAGGMDPWKMVAIGAVVIAAGSLIYLATRKKDGADEEKSAAASM